MTGPQQYNACGTGKWYQEEPTLLQWNNFFQCDQCSEKTTHHDGPVMQVAGEKNIRRAHPAKTGIDTEGQIGNNKKKDRYQSRAFHNRQRTGRITW